MLELSEHVLFSSRLAGLSAYVQILYLTLFIRLENLVFRSFLALVGI